MVVYAYMYHVCKSYVGFFCFFGGYSYLLCLVIYKFSFVMNTVRYILLLQKQNSCSA